MNNKILPTIYAPVSIEVFFNPKNFEGNKWDEYISIYNNDVRFKYDNYKYRYYLHIGNLKIKNTYWSFSTMGKKSNYNIDIIKYWIEKIESEVDIYFNYVNNHLDCNGKGYIIKYVTQSSKINGFNVLIHEEEQIPCSCNELII